MQTTNCHTAIEYLLTHLEHPDLHPIEADMALNHIKTCPYCQPQVGYLVRALQTVEEDSLTCQECEALLPDYLEAESEGQTGGVRWQPVALHLATCPSCSAAYTLLTDLTALAYGERGVEPPSYPRPELSFLQAQEAKPAQPVSVSWRLNKLGRLIVEFSAESVRALQPSAYAGAGLRKSAQSPQTLLQLSLPEPVEDLDVTITAEGRRADPARCTVMVKVNIPSRGGWPHLAGTEVTIKKNAAELDTQLTDAHGEVSFEGVATGDLAELVFEITPPVNHET